MKLKPVKSQSSFQIHHLRVPIIHNSVLSFCLTFLSDIIFLFTMHLCCIGLLSDYF